MLEKHFKIAYTDVFQVYKMYIKQFNKNIDQNINFNLDILQLSENVIVIDYSKEEKSRNLTNLEIYNTGSDQIR